MRKNLHNYHKRSNEEKEIQKKKTIRERKTNREYIKQKDAQLTPFDQLVLNCSLGYLQVNGIKVIDKNYLKKTVDKFCDYKSKKLKRLFIAKKHITGEWWIFRIE